MHNPAPVQQSWSIHTRMADLVARHSWYDSGPGARSTRTTDPANDPPALNAVPFRGSGDGLRAIPPSEARASRCRGDRLPFGTSVVVPNWPSADRGRAV